MLSILFATSERDLIGMKKLRAMQIEPKANMTMAKFW